MVPCGVRHEALVINENVTIRRRKKWVTWEYRLAPRADSVGRARRHVRYALEPHLDAQTLADIELVVSELVTNAVRHGPGELITLRLLTDSEGMVSGEVEDQGDGVVAIRAHDAGTAVGGLGLPLVEALTSTWGVYPGSTHVWFRFDAP